MFKIVSEDGKEVLDTDIMNINANDIIILKIDATISLELLNNITEKLNKTFIDNKYIFLPKECEIGVLKREINVLQKTSNRKVLKE